MSLRSIAVGGLGTLLLGILSVFAAPTTLRVRTTLVIDDNGREVRGSNVVEIVLAKNGFGTPYSMGMRGEALVVDLGPRGLLFMVRRNASGSYGQWEMLPESTMARALGITPSWDNRAQTLRDLAARGRNRPVEVPFGKLPMLVRFRDIDDPSTVEQVDPNHLDKSFGPGMRLVRATLEVTSEPVTTGIDQQLRWLAGGYPEKGLVPPHERKQTGEISARVLKYDAFKKGSK